MDKPADAKPDNVKQTGEQQKDAPVEKKKSQLILDEDDEGFNRPTIKSNIINTEEDKQTPNSKSFVNLSKDIESCAFMKPSYNEKSIGERKVVTMKSFDLKDDIVGNVAADYKIVDE